MKTIKFLICLLLFPITLISQNMLMVDLEYDNAERSFEEAEYRDALLHLKEAEKQLGQWSPKISYLRIQCLRELANFTDENNVESQELYTEINAYLTAMDKRDSRDVSLEKYREVVNLKNHMISIGIYEKLSPGYREKQQQLFMEKSLNEARSGDVTAIRFFVENFPKHKAVNELQKLLVQKEKEYYQTAKRTQLESDYQQYVYYFPRGEHYNEMAEGLALQEELNAYREVEGGRKIADAERYLSTYPKGTYKAEVEAILEDALFSETKDAFNAKEYDRVFALEQKNRQYFENGKHHRDMNNLVELARDAKKKQEKIDARRDKTYFMLSYHLDNSYGFEVGKLNESNKLGAYIRFNANPHIFKIDEAQHEIDRRSQTTENLLPSFFTTAFGLQRKIKYPIWIYGGIGARFKHYIGEDSDHNYVISSEGAWVFFSEFGVKSNLGNKIVLKLGAQYVKGKPALQLGIGF